MGCSASKKSKKQFKDELKKVHSDLGQLASSRTQLHRQLGNLPVVTKDEDEFHQVKEELTVRLDKLHEVVRDIERLNISQKLFRTYQHKHRQSHQLLEAASEPDISKAVKKLPARVNSHNIIEDPSIKAMIEANRRKLEKRARRLENQV